jgi:hypothetical protein
MHATCLAQETFSIVSFQRIRPRPRPCVTFRTKLDFTVKIHLPFPHSPSWKTTPCRMFSTASRIYSRLPSLSLIHKPRTRHAVETRDPLNYIECRLWENSKYLRPTMWTVCVTLQYRGHDCSECIETILCCGQWSHGDFSHWTGVMVVPVIHFVCLRNFPEMFGLLCIFF